MRRGIKQPALGQLGLGAMHPSSLGLNSTSTRPQVLCLKEFVCWPWHVCERVTAGDVVILALSAFVNLHGPSESPRLTSFNSAERRICFLQELCVQVLHS